MDHLKFKQFFSGYMCKTYEVKFWKFFTLVISSEDREDGTFKHFVTVYFRNKRLVNVTYRTGVTNKMLDGDYADFESGTFVHFPLKHFYMGTVSIEDKTYTFDEGKKSYYEDREISNEFISEFKNVEMGLFVTRSSFVKMVHDYYFKEKDESMK